jgi:hypothetical protein
MEHNSKPRMGDETLRGGRYQVVGKLGEGAQGTTFDAVDATTGTSVAIKRFSVRGAKSWKDVELAEREASVLETLSHPALPAHVEHFEEDGALYLVMQKIDGQSLAALTARGGALSRADVLRFLQDAASVLEYLHGRSPPVIHRDINPKNVIRRPDGSFALVDFGAVRDRLKPEGGSTIVGTFGYMAPEQLQGRALPATDVYSVGATALRLLTGREPETLPHRGLAIDVAAALGSAGDPALREVLAKMLDPDPDRRASSLSPLLKRLEPRDTKGRRSPDEPRRSSERRDDKEWFGDREPRRQRAADPRHDDPGSGNPWQQGARQWGPGAWTWNGGDAEYWAGEGARWARAEKERARDRYRKNRKDRRRDAHEERHARRQRRRARPVNGPPLVFLLLGLNLAIFVVGLMLGVVVPAFLVLLSIVFGRPLREAARATRLAGENARKAMNRAQQYLLHGDDIAEPTDVSEPDVHAHEANSPEANPGTRVDEPPRARVRVDAEVVDTTGVDASDPAERREHRS